MFSIAMYVCFSQLEEEEAKKRKRKINEIKIVDKVKVKCLRTSHESICVWVSGCSLYIHS